MTISYGKDLEVALGNTLPVAKTQEVPEIHFVTTNPSPPSTKYTLILTDPDAPSRTEKKWSEYAHYVISDLSIKSTDIKTASNVQDTRINVENDGDTLLPYMGPGPPPKTGKHRYVFLLYEQPDGVKVKAPKDRPNWGTGIPASGARDWAKGYGLKLLAINFFFAQNVEQ